MKRFLTLFLVLALATMALAACGGDDEDAGLGEDETLVEEPLVEDDTDIDEVEVEDIGEDDIDSDTGEVIDEGEDVDLVEDDTLDEETFVAPDFVLGNQFAGLSVFDETDAELGTVNDFLFNEFGEVEYVVVDSALGGTFIVPADRFEADLAAPLAERRLTFTGTEDDLLAETEFDPLLLEDENPFIDPATVGVETEGTTLLELGAFQQFAILDPNRAEVGAVNDFVMAPADFRVSFVALELGPMMGVDSNIVVLPIEQLAFDPVQSAIMINADPAIVQTAPVLDPGLFTDPLLFEQQFDPTIDVADFGAAPAIDQAELDDDTDLVEEDDDLLDDDTAFDTYDADDDELLDENEFGTFLSDEGLADEGQFDIYDLNDDEFLDEDEFNTFREDEGLGFGDSALDDETVDADTGRFVLVSPTMIQMETMLGLTVEDEFGDEFATVSDFLFNEEGAIEYFVIETEDGERLALPYTSFQSDIGRVEEAWSIMVMDDVTALDDGIDETLLESDELFVDPLLLGLESDFDRLFWASNFGDMQVISSLTGEDLGEIEQSLVDFVNWRVAFGVMDVGGFLEIGEKQVPIPFAAFSYDLTEEAFVLNATDEQLEAAPEVNLAEELGVEEEDATSDPFSEAGVYDFWETELGMEIGPTEPLE